MNEIHTQYVKLGVMILKKALDDICPTYEGEEEEEKKLKIAERIKFFSMSEVLLDKEWKELEKEAEAEVRNFKKERDTIFSKIAKTNNSAKVQVKVDSFEVKKQARVEYLTRKMDKTIETFTEALSDVEKGTKKHIQAEAKIKQLEAVVIGKIKKTELRYNTIIKNTLNSDNSERVAQRLEQSKAVWARKYNELRDKHLTKETIHNHRRMEFDQIRTAIDGFPREIEHIRHWCTLSQVAMKDCYTQAIKRAKMVERDYSNIEKALKEISAGGI